MKKGQVHSKMRQESEYQIRRKGRIFNSIYNNRRVSKCNQSLIKKYLTESFFLKLNLIHITAIYQIYVGGKIDCIIFIDPNNEIININDFVIGSAGGITHKLEIDKNKNFLSGNKYIDKMVLEMIENNIR